MPRHPTEEDLFRDSTMTFGQHLEELRVCLFKAILGLAVGLAVGMVAGFWVVDIIQNPLRKALAEYYNQQAFKAADHVATELRQRGFSEEEIAQFLAGTQERMKKENVTFEVRYLDRADLLRMLQGKSATRDVAQAPTAEQLTEAERGQLVPMPIYQNAPDDPRIQLKSFNAQEPFMIYLKASLMVGVILASPWIFYQIWTFVAAGLYPNEKHYVHLFLPVSLALFLAGAGLAFFFVFEPVLRFLFSFYAMLGINPEPRINEWLGFVLLLPLGFGVSFQLPLVMLFIERIGIVSVEAYVKSWRIAVLAIFVLAMILTPSGDPYSMLLMAGPLCVLYVGGIVLCRYLPRHRSAFEETRGMAK